MYEIKTWKVIEAFPNLRGLPDGVALDSLFVEIIPVSWLPITEVKKYAKFIQGSNPAALDIDGQMDATFDALNDLLPQIVKDWNLVGHDGKPIPVPTKEHPDTWQQSYMGIIGQIMVEAGKDDADIPFQNAQQSTPPSNREARRHPEKQAS